MAPLAILTRKWRVHDVLGLLVHIGAFHYGPHADTSVQYITDAYRLLAPAVGNHAAKILFAVGLLASGQNSTITGTLAGQVCMPKLAHFDQQGFLPCISLPPKRDAPATLNLCSAHTSLTLLTFPRLMLT